MRASFTGRAIKLVVPFLVVGICLVVGSVTTNAALPQVLIEGCRLEQIAREPEVVTPVGIAFDAKGRLLVVESHTHQRPDDYNGPAGDRLRMLSISSDGNSEWSTFAEGYRHAMNVAVRPDGKVYLVTRSDVHLLQDIDDDGKADSDQKIVELRTTADYPHNALSGITVAGDRLFLGVGENSGVEYDLVGSDGRSIKNVGGVGTIYSCHGDGSKLKRFAEGFWNPFSLCLTNGNLLCVDNDPDASPPCRLIQVIERGDYGFRYEYGRAGVHPLQAWNGELPGTLPILCGTGEAPTAVVFHRGYLWVTSWGDYRIERYQLSLQEDGFYNAEREIVVQGDADFRPTGMAVAPDGSLWFGDWVDRSYPVHGKGRIWRLELPNDMKTELPTTTAQPQATGPDLSGLHAIRWKKDAPRDELEETLKQALTDTDPDIRLYAVRIAAEEHLTELRSDVEKLLNQSPPNERYYLAVLAAVDWLGREPEQRHSGITDGLLARELRNPQRDPEMKALALNLMSPDYKDLTLELLSDYLRNDHEPLRIAAARTIAEKTTDDRFAVLVEIVTDESLTDVVRVEALSGLAAKPREHHELLTKFASNDSHVVKNEAARILRLSDPTHAFLDEKPAAGDIAAWLELLAEPGNAAAGRRLFFSSVGPRCSACHRHSGRGGNVGPDLTNIGKSQSRKRVITSILDPSREVAPHFETWLLVTDDGKTHVGQRLAKGGDDGVEPYADTSGNLFELKSGEITHRQSIKTSIMPAGLEKNLSVEDLRDLVTFLME